MRTNPVTRKLQLGGLLRNFHYDSLRVFLKAKTDYKEGGDQSLPLMILNLASTAFLISENDTIVQMLDPQVITREMGIKAPDFFILPLHKASKNTKEIKIKDLGLKNK